MRSYVVLLTTWNRPSMLRRSLPLVLWQAGDIPAPLVISDDYSDDRDTLNLLETAKMAGAEVIAPPRRCDDAHRSTGANMLFAMRYVLDEYAPDAVVKLDDDLELAVDALPRLVRAHEAARAESEHPPALTTGMLPRLGHVVADHGTWRRLHGASACACVIEADDWRDFVAQHDEVHTIARGWDGALCRWFTEHRTPRMWMACPERSVVRHADPMGVHQPGPDYNTPGDFDEPPVPYEVLHREEILARQREYSRRKRESA